MILTFEGIPNVRDLGGYTMQDGRTIRSGCLIRGGYLVGATENDITRLQKEYHVTHIFDFRTEGERLYAPDKQIEGVRNTWLPTLDVHTDQKIEQFPEEAYRDLPNYLMKIAFTDKGKRMARTLYPSMIDNEYTQLQYASFLQQIINTSDGAIYWHCSQGKDRTGIGAAFLLAALGASRETIIRDFDLSNDGWRPLLNDCLRRIERLGGGEEEKQVIQAFIGVNTQYFIDTLNYIDQNYGSLLNYIRDVLLIFDSDMDILKERYLV